MVSEMEPLIQEIIAMDKAARQKVAEQEACKCTDKKQIEEKKQAIEIAAQKAAEKRLADLKKQNEKDMAMMTKALEQRYETSVKRLRDHFASNKEQWLAELMKHCTGH